MPQATGALSKILGVAQTALRELPDPLDAEVLYVQSFQFDSDEPLEQDPTLGGGYRGELRGDKGPVNATGSAVVTLGTSIGFWLKHLVGEPTTVGASAPYTHTFAVSAAKPIPPAITFERDYSSRIPVPGRYERDMNVRIGSGAFAFQTGSAYQQATFNLVGMTVGEQPEDPMDETPSDFGHAGFAVGGMSLVLDDGATEVCVESLNVNWNNELDNTLRCLNAGGALHDLPEGNAIITIDGVAQFDTPVLRTKALAGTSLKLVVILQRGTGAGTTGNEKLTLTIPLSVLTANAPPISGPRGLKQAFTARAYRNGGAEVGVTFELKSPRATI